MSNQSPFGARSGGIFPVMPRGEVIAAYTSYPEAQLTVDALAHADFPVASVSIIGNDLKTVEHVTGRLSWGRVAGAGAGSGAWFGVFVGIVLYIFGGGSTSLSFVFAAILLGAGFGMLFSLVSYALTRRRRDYTSRTQVLATSYAVIVEPELANRARNLLSAAGRGTGDVGPSAL